MIEIRPLQMVCLEILKEIDRICTKYNIQYWLEGGSMLGAVRHHGFIPWDDDLDIAMFREDYERFLKIAQKELKPEYFLQTHEIEREYPLFFAKVRKNNTYIEEECFLSLNFHKGIFVDIFPVDKLPYGVNKVKVYCKKLRILFLFYMLLERKVKTRIIRKHPILFNTIRFYFFLFH